MPFPYLQDDENRRENAGDQPTSGTMPVSAPVLLQQSQAPTYDIGAAYRSALGRDPDARELASEQENLGKYGSAQLEANLRERAKSTGDRIYDSQSAAGNAMYGSGTNNATNTPTGGYQAPAFRNTSPTFSDPSQRLIEDSSLARYAQLQNPGANSGQAMYEQEIKNLIQTLKGPVYSAGDEATIKAGALDAVMRDRDQTKQRWLEEVSRRGMAPSSGPALEGLRRIDEHYKTLQTTVDAQFARDAIDQTRAQRQQVVSNAGLLAGTENNRLDQALDVARIPYNLSNDAFSRNLSLVNTGGSPSSLLNSALQLYAANQQASAYNSQQRQALANGLLQYLGYAFG